MSVCIGTSNTPCPTKMVLFKKNQIRCRKCAAKERSHSPNRHKLKKAQIAEEIRVAKESSGIGVGIAGAKKVVEAMMKAEYGI